MHWLYRRFGHMHKEQTYRLEILHRVVQYHWRLKARSPEIGQLIHRGLDSFSVHARRRTCGIHAENQITAARLIGERRQMLS